LFRRRYKVLVHDSRVVFNVTMKYICLYVTVEELNQMFKNKIKSVRSVAFLLTCVFLSGNAQSNVRQAIADDLVSKYGSIDEVLLNIDKLSVYEQNAFSEYVIQLEYQKLKTIYDNRTSLEVLDAEQQKNDLFLEKKLNSDPIFIEKMRRLTLQAEIAQNKLLHEPPESLIDTIPFDPSLPQELILQVYPGFPGAISFFDQTGAAWPIVYVKQGSDQIFTSKKMPNNAYSLEAKEAGVTNSGWFVLEGLDTTIPFRITSRNTDYFNQRRQVILPLIGPNATPEVVTDTRRIDINKAGPEFYAFLSGTTHGISGAKQVELTGITGQAFTYQNSIYIRTTMELRGKGSSLIREGKVGTYNLYQLYPRAFYWFYQGRQKVKAFVKTGDS